MALIYIDIARINHAPDFLLRYFDTLLEIDGAIIQHIGDSFISVPVQIVWRLVRHIVLDSVAVQFSRSIAWKEKVTTLLRKGIIKIFYCSKKHLATIDQEIRDSTALPLRPF